MVIKVAMVTMMVTLENGENGDECDNGKVASKDFPGNPSSSCKAFAGTVEMAERFSEQNRQGCLQVPAKTCIALS